MKLCALVITLRDEHIPSSSSSSSSCDERIPSLPASMISSQNEHIPSLSSTRIQREIDCRKKREVERNKVFVSMERLLRDFAICYIEKATIPPAILQKLAACSLRFIATIDECCCCILKPQTTKRGREIKGSLCPLSWFDPKNYGTTHKFSDLIVFWARQMTDSTLKWVKESILIYKKRLQRYKGDVLKLKRCKTGFSAIREISSQLNVIGQLIADKKDSSVIDSTAPPVEPDHPIDDQLRLSPKLPPRLPP
ncbi:hypothetical protein ADUPG1_007303 [Aduncisulcus paluster]|uniref:Uncharacterized protein n=1 Tax=Aduncisulcus paluster TaxID=2918883 RepID=A0ABQ5KPB6_9EUKA|nr:hypothetical protein ADUPG1_007303 [Aduncisulcus paluster]